ncbi:glycerol kinase GlpK [Hydrogenibacillus sp. N12]|uniref:glycerol kinase GlpK n=1 Tax=Hydrogenibacillus sp. N12 TaxID=2866627 RepID=UPI001C7D1312|nr:glycerol kinase GlpK [Hydrogenibacillus sp. N12]QZA33680.1 glycerol kinase GlpK [Hydrogenibacillus sp. N12]
MKKGAVVLALDQGTTSSRAIVFDREGRPLGAGRRPIRQHYPRPGWVEHDPEELFRSVVEAGREALAAAGVGPEAVTAIGITNQRETAIVWERRTGRPVHPAIVWQDRRTAEWLDRLRAEGVEGFVRERTGLLLDPYFSASKVRWILEATGRRDEAKQGDLAFGTVDSWLIDRLTGGRVHGTDPSNASRTLLFSLADGAWDPALLALFDVPEAMLPEIRPSDGPFGVAEARWFGAEIPIAGVLGDQQAALFGQAAFSPGEGKNTLGTGAFLLLHTGEWPAIAEAGLLATVAWRLGARTAYALEGSVFIAGAVVQWLRDGLGLIREAAETAALASAVPDSGGVYFVPAFSGLGAPHWDPYARGTIVGLTRGTDRRHLVRAALEAIAYQTRDVVEAMQEAAGTALSVLRIDGGAAANDWLMQFQADVLGLPVERAREREATALGVAYLAGLSAGWYRDLEEIRALWQADRRFEPKKPPAWREAAYAGWKRAVERAKGWASAGGERQAAPPGSSGGE